MSLIPTSWRGLPATIRIRRLGSARASRCAHRRQQAQLRRAQWRLARGTQIEEQRKIFGVVTRLAGRAVWPTALALLLLLITEWAGRLVLHVRWLRLPLLGQLLDGDKYQILASTEVVAEATLLALFFATIGVVASTTYSSVPATIRNLFIEERTSTVYSKGIARALVFTSALLALSTAGYHARVLTVVVAAILAIVAVLRLLVIGTATFSYFDPASLTEVLPGRFQHALTRAVTGSTAADKANQLRAHKDAATVLDHYRRITDLLTGEPVPNSDAPVAVCSQLLALNIGYAPVKNRIPTTSSWWGPALQYPNWLTLDTAELTVALATSTGIQASDANDLYWVERRSAADISQLLTVAARDNISAVTGLIDLASAHIRRLSRLFQTDEALIFEDELVSTIWSCIYDKPNPIGDDGVQLTLPSGDSGQPSSPSDDRDHTGGWDRVIAAERSVVLLTDAWLGLVEAATRIARADLASLVEQAFERRGAHQLMDVARPVRKLIEEILERLDMEKRTEGQRITPSLWLRHHVARTLLAHFLAARNAIQSRVSLRTTQAVQDAMERGEWRIAANVGLASLQLDDRLRTHLPAMKSVAAALENLRSQAVDDPRWPKPAEISLEPDAELRPWLHRQLADCMQKLAAQPHDPAQPDLFGQLHTVLFEAAFEAILDSTHPVANVLFGALFQQMGPTAARLSTDLTGQNLTAQILYGQEPIMAMMELSGYAIFMNALNGGDTWSMARQLWDSLRALRGPDLPKNLAEIAAQDDSIFALTSIAMTRQARRQRLTSVLHNHGIASSSASTLNPFAPPPSLHPSPLIAAFLGHGVGVGNPWDLTDLFLAHYIAEQLDDVSILPQGAQSLASALDDAAGVTGDDVDEESEGNAPPLDADQEDGGTDA